MYRIIIEDDNTEQGNLIDNIDNVSSKLKPLSKDQIHKATAEVEKGEFILNPETFTLHKALGKRHNKGGTPVNIPENSFIFSDFKDLGFNKSDEKRFEFKLGGSKLKFNTPAKVLEKNVDIKHHNKMINILNSKTQDDIAKNSANLMLTKNLNTIGKVAYVQEGKKGFPQGIPSFSQGTAPVYKKEVDDDITQSVQYMKRGGLVIPKYQAGKSTYNNRQKFWSDQNQLMLYPEIEWNGTQHANDGIYDKAREDEFRRRNPWFYAKYPNASMRNPQDVKTFQQEYNKLYQDEFNGENYFEGDNDMGIDGKFGNHTFNAPAFIHHSNYETNDFKDLDGPGNYNTIDPNASSPVINRTSGTIRKPTQQNSSLLGQYNWNGTPVTPAAVTSTTPKTDAELNAGDPTKQPYTNQMKPVGFTPWQNFNMALPLLNKMAIKSQYPLYQQQRSIAPEQTLMSADPLLNQSGMDYTQAANMNRVLNPNMAYSSNSELYGKKLDANNQAISSINQTNAQIQNQQNQTNAQTYNTDMMNNLKFNKQYYDELSTTKQNRDRYKDFYNNQFMTNANQMIAENQAFNNLLGTQKTYDGKPLYTPVSNGFGYSMQLTPGLDPDILFNQQFNGNTNLNAIIQQLQSDIAEARASGDWKAVASLNSTLRNYTSSNIPKQKLGGRIPKFKL